jgi:carboxylate-amine ligase
VITANDVGVAPVWPDTAGDLPFALHRPVPGVLPPRPDEARLLRSYLDNPRTPETDEAVGVVHGEVVTNPLYDRVLATLENLGPAELRARAIRRDRLLTADGVTFGGLAAGHPRRPFPIDLMPRILPADQWGFLRRAVQQRIAALGAFLDDVYGEQRILAAGVVPRVVVETSPGWHDAGRMTGRGAPRAVMAGTDLLHDRHGRWLVLEDDLRMPSGLGYALEARRTMATVLPELTPGSQRQWVSTAPHQLRRALEAAAPTPAGGEPAIAVLSTGPSDSAWFEHRMLASAMKVPIVLPRDLISVGDRIAILRPDGPRRIDVLYRRCDEDALTSARSATGDPLLPQLLHAVGAGTLRLANAVGNGIADDKAVYAFVPAMIRYYLGEEPLLDNVETRVLADPDSHREVIGHLEDYVIKPVDAPSGQGIVLGPQASAAELDELRRRIEARPEGFVAQELVDFTTHPTLMSHRLEPRRVDLRVFTVCTPEPEVLSAPLTRVAMRPGSLVVNSSRGGGAKDTWIVG